MKTFEDIAHRAEQIRQAIEDDTAAVDEFRHKILKCSPALVVQLNTSIIVHATEVVTKMFGYVNGELVGMPVDVLIPHRFREAHDGHFAAFSGNPTERTMGGSDMHLYGLGKDGKEFPVEIGLYPFKARDGLMYVLATVVRQRG